MAKKTKYYAVKKGNKMGVFDTWEECQEAVKGFSGAEYKSFETEEEANAYLQDKDIMFEEYILPYLKKQTIVAFTDGSFNPEKMKYGSGVYIITPNDNRIELTKSGNNEKYLSKKNIPGEIFAVLDAIDWAWKNGYENIAVFYDYEGLEKWTTGEWEANNNLTKFYKNKIAELQEIINIEFIKIKAHSSNLYNDKADKLAKSAVNENRILKDRNGNNGYVINSVKKEDIERLIHTLRVEVKDLKIEESSTENKFIWGLKSNNEKLTISLFNDIKLLVQGKLSNLFSYTTTRIIEEICSDDFIKILKSAYNINIDENSVKCDFQNYLPQLFNKQLPEGIVCLLEQSIINIKIIDRYSKEFSMYTSPVLRSLEGVLKLNLYKCKIELKNGRFNMFTKDDKGSYRLSAKHRIGIEEENIHKLENCYNYYYNNRHTLAHFGIILDETCTATTRLLDTKEQANLIIKETLKIINDNFII